ncbi:MAG TPA: hypothetical protein PKI03_05515 [Pseudomonadota bacterium]|jgi:hypothetical protein|nr:hypothetical protein [Pseudomonadota bacterium]
MAVTVGTVSAVATGTEKVAKEVGKATLEVAKEAKTVAGVDEALKRGDVSALALSTAAKLCADPLVKSVEYSGIVKELARDGQLVQAALKECGLDVWLYQGAKDLDLWLDKAGLGKPVCALVETFDDLKRFEQDCLAWADHHHVLLTAKKVEFVLEKPIYEKGILTKLPLVGNLADLVMKHQLGEELSLLDWVKVGGDLMTVVTVVTSDSAGPALKTLGTKAFSGGIGELNQYLNVKDSPGAFENAPSPYLVDKEALRNLDVNAYLKEKITEAGRWAHTKEVPIVDGCATPREINQRFNDIAKNLHGYAGYLYQNEPAFARLIDGSVTKLQEATKLGPGAVQQVETQLKRQATGELARCMVRDTFSPYFKSCDTEVRLNTGDTFTKIDILLSDARVPIHGKGGLSVKVGQNLAIECKAGQAAYLGSQIEHMLFQAAAPVREFPAISVVTKDLHHLETSVVETIREKLRDSGMPVFRFLPEKDRLDEAVISLTGQLAKVKGDRS